MIRQDLRSARKKVLKIQQEFSEECIDGIEYRGFGQEIVEDLAKYAGVPVWNGLTNEYHPTQMLADMLTIREHFGHLKGIKLVYMGDARYNMGNSLMIACCETGNAFCCMYNIKNISQMQNWLRHASGYAKESGATITLTEDVKKEQKMQMLSTQMYGYLWVSRTKYGRSVSKSLSPYKVTKESYGRMQERRQSSYTACRHSMI